jgi:hypothetical protein
MGKLLFLVLLAGGGWWAWQNGLVPMPAGIAPPSPAFEAYARFSEHLAHDQYGNARGLATRGAVRAVQIRELRGRRNTRLGISGYAVTKDDQEEAAKGVVLGVSHELLSEETSADGRTVTIEALARVCRRHAGCEEKKHDVEVCLHEEIWKVCSFHESDPTPDDSAEAVAAR